MEIIKCKQEDCSSQIIYYVFDQNIYYCKDHKPSSDLLNIINIQKQRNYLKQIINIKPYSTCRKQMQVYLTDILLLFKKMVIEEFNQINRKLISDYIFPKYFSIQERQHCIFLLYKNYRNLDFSIIKNIKNKVQKEQVKGFIVDQINNQSTYQQFYQKQLKKRYQNLQQIIKNQFNNNPKFQYVVFSHQLFFKEEQYKISVDRQLQQHIQHIKVNPNNGNIYCAINGSKIIMFEKNDQQFKSPINVVGKNKTGKGLQQFDSIFGMSFSSFQLFVSDFNNHRVKSVNLQNKIQKELFNSNDQPIFKNPTGLVYVQEQNSLIICDMNNNRLVQGNLQTNRTDQLVNIIMPICIQRLSSNFYICSYEQNGKIFSINNSNRKIIQCFRQNVVNLLKAILPECNLFRLEPEHDSG